MTDCAFDKEAPNWRQGTGEGKERTESEKAREYFLGGWRKHAHFDTVKEDLNSVLGRGRGRNMYVHSKTT